MNFATISMSSGFERAWLQPCHTPKLKTHRHYKLRENLPGLAEASGHDFSRAGKAIELSLVLATALFFSTVCKFTAAKAVF
jgi:hypothetical protein